MDNDYLCLSTYLHIQCKIPLPSKYIYKIGCIKAFIDTFTSQKVCSPLWVTPINTSISMEQLNWVQNDLRMQAARMSWSSSGLPLRPKAEDMLRTA